MKKKFKPFHWIVPVLTIPIFLLFAGYYGWISYATLSDRNGLWGNIYSYYDLSKERYLSIRIGVSIALVGLIVFQSKFLFEKKINQLNRTILTTLVFVVLWIFLELYLQTKFVGKG